jgi:hypothetical protein
MKTCPICGAEFPAPPSSKKITCSGECSRIRKRQTHLGKRNAWPIKSRRRVAEAGQTPNLKKGSPAAKQSPNAGPFETNINALVWTLKGPDNRVYRVRNLSKFIRDNPGKFHNTPNLARAGLAQVRRSMQGKTKRAVTQWKGWRVLNVEDP